MVVAVEPAGGNLLSRSHAYSKPALRVFATQLVNKQHSRSREDLVPAVVRAALVISRVEFNLRPEILRKVRLDRRVPQDRPSKLRGIRNGQASPQRTLHVKDPDSLAEPHIRRDSWIEAAVLVAAGGNRGRQEGA